jgi:hypothetical protein
MNVRNARLPIMLAVETLSAFAAVALFVWLFSGAGGPAPSLVSIAAVVLGSFALTQASAAHKVRDAHARLAAILLGAVALFLILHTEYAAGDPPWRMDWLVSLASGPGTALADRGHVVVGCAALALLWLRGVWRWSMPVEPPAVLSSVTGGFIAIALAAAIGPAARGPHPFGAIGLAFFVLAWCLLALWQTADADEPLPTFAARWAAAFGLVFVSSAVFVLLVAAFDPSSLGFLEPLGTGLLKAIGIAAAYMLAPIFAAIEFLFSLLPFHSSEQQPQTPAPAPPLPGDTHGGTPIWFQIVAHVLAGGAVTVLALSFFAAIWFALRRYTQHGPGTAEQRHPVERDGGVAQDLVGLFDRFVRRFRRPSAPGTTVEIRRLYHQVLARAEADGLPRTPSRTPHQFAPLLNTHYRSDVPSAITRAFVASRYGLDEIDSRTVHDLRERWVSLLRST